MAQTLLLFGQRAEMPLAAPVAARAAYPLIEDAAAIEVHAVLELRDQVGELRIALGRAQLVGDLERHRHRPRTDLPGSGASAIRIW